MFSCCVRYLGCMALLTLGPVLALADPPVSGEEPPPAGAWHGFPSQEEADGLESYLRSQKAFFRTAWSQVLPFPRVV